MSYILDDYANLIFGSYALVNDTDVISATYHNAILCYSIPARCPNLSEVTFEKAKYVSAELVQYHVFPYSLFLPEALNVFLLNISTTTVSSFVQVYAPKVMIAGGQFATGISNLLAAANSISAPYISGSLCCGTYYTLSAKEYIDLPNAEILSSVYLSKSASRFHIPNVKTITGTINLSNAVDFVFNGYYFYSIAYISMLSVPNVREFGSINNCSLLKSLSLPNLYCFVNISNASTLSKIVLPSDHFCIVNPITTSLFAFTPMSNSTYLGYFGSIYAPSSLISVYAVANRWSNFSDRFVPLETLEISFAISNLQQSATWGLSWGSWVNTSYNVDAFQIVNGSVFTSDGISYISGVSDGDLITEEGMSYTLVTA